MHHEKRITVPIGNGVDDRPPARMAAEAMGVISLARARANGQDDDGGYHRIPMVDSTYDPDVVCDIVHVARNGVPAAQMVPWDQHLVVIGGRGTVHAGDPTAGGGTYDVTVGDVILIPRQLPHRLRASREEELHLARWQYRHARKEGDEAPNRVAADAARVVHVADRMDDEFLIIEGVFITELANFEGCPGVSTDRARIDAGVTAAEHRLSVDERYLILEGRGHVDLAGRRFAIAPGDVVSIPAGTPQRIVADAGENIVFYCVCTPRFDPDDFTKLQDPVFPAGYRSPPTGD